MSSGYLTSDRRMMQEMARTFTREQVTPLANRLDPEKGDIPRSLIDQMGELGFFGILIPVEHGGLGLGAFEYCLVAEELARLRSHLDEIARLLEKGGEAGKRLDFLIQELLREANTMGSKSAALELTNISVEMKVAIEQLREQVQNLE